MGRKPSYSQARRVSISELEKIGAPLGTKTWKPIKHADLLKSVEKALKKQKIKISKRELTVQRRDEFFYGVLDLRKVDNTDYFPAIAIRSSNNKSVAIEIFVGVRVKACDNLGFYNSIALKRKHTSGLQLDKEIDEAIQIYLFRYQEFTEQIKLMKKANLLDNQAKLIIIKGFMDNKVFPMRCFERVYNEYFKNKETLFKDRTFWSLYNAFLTVAKEIPDARRFIGFKRLGKLFNSLPELSLSESKILGAINDNANSPKL